MYPYSYFPLFTDNGDNSRGAASSSHERIQQFLRNRQGVCEAWWMDAYIHYRHGMLESRLFLHDFDSASPATQARVVYCLLLLELHRLSADLQLHSDHFLLLQH